MYNSLKTWLVPALLLGTAIYAIAEDITLTTYYPSPRGVYQELKTAGDMVVGDITNPPAARLHVVQEGTADALRVDDELSDTSPVLVDASGNVGIGTANPTVKLDVQGGFIYASKADATVSRMGLQNTLRQWTISNYGTDFAPNGALVIADETAPAVRMVIDTAGNVGIGTASPGTYDGQPARVDVNGYAATNDVWLKDVGRWAGQGGGSLSCVYRVVVSGADTGDTTCAAFGETCVGFRIQNDWGCGTSGVAGREAKCCKAP